MMDPEPDSWMWIIWVALMLLASAFFSGMEIAFVSANKLKIELDKKQGVFGAGLLSKLTHQPARFIGAMLVGNNLALVIFGTIMQRQLDPILMSYTGLENEWLILLMQTIISTIVVLVFAEFLPKTIFQLNPNGLLRGLTIPLIIIYYVLWLPMYLTIGIAEGILKYVLRIDTEHERNVFGRVDLNEFVSSIIASAETTEDLDHEVQIFQNALDFSKVKARECMIPRTEIVAYELEDDIEIIRQRFVDTGLSKILIYRETIDHVIGYVHSSELFKRPEKTRQILMPVAIIPESMIASDILELFIKGRRSVAIVVDEFGGTAGMVTIEDIVEEIFGEIEDEHDQELLTEDQISDNEYRLSARIEIDYLNEKYTLNLPESEEYETLAGLILSEHESIPEEGEVLQIEDWAITVQKVSENKIDLVNLVREEQDSDG